MNTKMSKLVVAMAAMVMAGGAWAADNATSTVTATVVTPISVTATDMSFGKFYASASAGTVTLNTSGGRTVTGGASLVTTSPGAAAVFTVTGTGDSTFTIAYTDSSTALSNGTPANDMAVNWITEAVAGTGPANTKTDPTTDATSGTLSGGSAKIYAGGVLTVAADQPAGTYTGSLKVTVAYN